MKIVFFEVPQDEQAIIQDFLAGHDLTILDAPLSEDNLAQAKEAEIISVFIKSRVTKEVIDALPSVRMINTRSTGFDHIDVAAAKNRSVVVTNVPAYGSHTVAEFAFALMLNLSRRIFPAYHQLREGAHFSTGGLEGFDLRGKTLGVIGTGKIGKNVIRIAKAFSMKVIAFDAYPDHAFAQEQSFEYVALDAALARSHIITIHIPYNRETHHLINAEMISKMKKGAYLINTARGEIVDTQALVMALKDGSIAGAGLDVLEGERELAEEASIIGNPAEHHEQIRMLLQNHVLIDMPNVVITPHIAFFTREARLEILDTTLSTIKDFNDGKQSNLIPS